jgi:hypothetical protein
MATSLLRRDFLKTAGGVAASGALLAGAGTASAATAESLALPFLPIFAIGTTDYLDFTQFVALSAPNSGSVLFYGASLSAVAYPSNAADYMVGTLPIPPNATLLSVSVLAKGPGSVSSLLYAHDMTNGGYTPATSVANRTTVPPVSGIITLTGLPAGYVVPAAHKMQLWITGINSATPLSGVSFTYQPENSGFYPISPTRVYDSRDVGQAGPLATGATRTVSVANATAFAGGALNVVPSGAYAVTYNLTAADTTGQGFLAIYPSGGTFKASALNWFVANELVANGGVVTLGGDREVTVQSGGGSTNFIIDITGYYI